MQFQTQMQQQTQRQHEKGSLLIELLLSVAIMSVLLSLLLPSVFMARVAANEDAAASQLSGILAAESQYAKYGAFVAPSSPGLPSALSTFNLLFPVSCSNAQLLPAQQTSAPSGFTMTATPGPVASGFTCAATGAAIPPIGYSSINLNFDPLNALQSQRHFFGCIGGSGCDGLVHYSVDRPAVAGDPVYTTSLAGSVSSGSGGSGGTNGVGGPNLWGGIWSSTSTVVAGESFLRPASIAGDSCVGTPTENNLVGIFISTDGVADDPCQNPQDWWFSGGRATWSPAPPPSQSGQVQNITVLGSGACPGSASSPFCDIYPLNFPNTAAITYTKASFALATLPVVGVQASVINQNSGQTIQCFIGTNTTTCNGTGSFTVNPGDQIYIGGYFNGQAINSERFAYLNWSVSQ